MILSAMFQGIFLGAGMIIPIGAQNAYILGQGINRNHHLLAATLCIICDITLILVGIFGASVLISSSELLMKIITWGGVLFLSFYGLISFKSFFKNAYEQSTKKSSFKSKKVVIATTIAVTLLNPHVYLDTVMILGSVGGQFEGDARLAFAVGTIIASIMWFYGLATGAAKMGPLLSKPSVIRGIDFAVGCIMWFIAFTLYMNTLN
ncbi:LysE/ArgO family amino acid transporter [Colwellia sp. RE-S-Sl-9]